MGKRKTIKIKKLVKVVNDKLLDEDISQETKEELSYMIQKILLETDQYGGFRYLEGYDEEKEYNRTYDMIDCKSIHELVDDGILESIREKRRKEVK